MVTLYFANDPRRLDGPVPAPTPAVPHASAHHDPILHWDSYTNLELSDDGEYIMCELQNLRKIEVGELICDLIQWSRLLIIIRYTGVYKIVINKVGDKNFKIHRLCTSSRAAVSIIFNRIKRHAAIKANEFHVQYLFILLITSILYVFAFAIFCACV